MVNFYKPNPSKNKSLINKVIELNITRTNLDGIGIGRFQNKPVYVEGAITGEQVKAKVLEQSNKFIKAKVIEIIAESENRVAAKCRHFQTCGGCDFQHLSYQAQLEFKQQKVTELFSRAGLEQQLPWCETITSAPFAYRRKARIGVQYNKHGKAIVGFRQKLTNSLVNVTSCPVLTDAIADIFPLLQTALDNLTATKSVGHIEVIDNGQTTNGQVSLCIRQLKKLNADDKAIWQALANEHYWQIYIDDGDTLKQLDGIVPLGGIDSQSDKKPKLTYQLEDNSVIEFGIKDFIQVNHQVNINMVTQALNWLELSQSDIVLDLFCGLGNFTLPIAKQVDKVIGVEGVPAMITKAQANATLNSIHNVKFYADDLNQNWNHSKWLNDVKIALGDKVINKVLLDPARAGAEAAVKNLLALNLDKIVYVSCEPSTLARDSAILIEHGYRIVKIAIMDMFAQTKHVETMVLFEQSDKVNSEN